MRVRMRLPRWTVLVSGILSLVTVGCWITALWNTHALLRVGEE